MRARVRCAASTPAAAVIPVYVCPSSPRNANPFKEHTQCWSGMTGFSPTRLMGVLRLPGDQQDLSRRHRLGVESDDGP